MEFTHFRAIISAPSKEVAEKVLDTLLNQKIIAGGLITHGPSRYWWKGKIENQEYYDVSTFIPLSKKEILIGEVRKLTPDETPIVALFPMDGNQDFLDWIDDSTK
jgi:periplasmic divalent cation tolerance protein